MKGFAMLHLNELLSLFSPPLEIILDRSGPVQDLFLTVFVLPPLPHALAARGCFPLSL